MGDGTPTAILTNKQRKYLRGEEEPTQERTMRTRIRERVRQGLLDFVPLVKYLDENDRERIFTESDGDFDPEETLPYLIAFAFQHHSKVHTPDGSLRDLETAVKEGIEIGGTAMGISTSAIVDISITNPDDISDTIDGIKRRLETQGVNAVSLEELRRLHDTGELTREGFNELYVQKMELIRERAIERVDEAEGDLEEQGYSHFGFLGDAEASVIFEEMNRRTNEDDNDET